jgi:F-type H+-transporting ATPase subunit delta
MKSTKASGRYASSLLQLALEQGDLEKVNVDMALVLGTVNASHELELMLESPIIKPSVKEKVLEKIFSSSVCKLSMQFMVLLAAKGREAILPQVAVSFKELYNQHHGIVSAEVVSAKTLSKSDRDDLMKNLSAGGHKIELKESVDPKVLGGLRIKMGDQLVDATIRRKLNDLRTDIFNHKLSAI